MYKKHRTLDKNDGVMDMGGMHLRKKQEECTYQFELQGYELTFVLVVGEGDAIRKLQEWGR